MTSIFDRAPAASPPLADATAIDAPDASLTTTQAAVQLTRDHYAWGPPGAAVNLSFAFRATDSDYNNGVDGFSQFSAVQIATTLLALQAWSDVADITFTRAGVGTSGPGAYSDDAQLLFGNYTSGKPGVAAFAYYPQPSPAAGDVWTNGSQEANRTANPFNFGGLTLVHEVGHALGLQHPGDYDANDGEPVTYDANAEYIQDSLQYSVMSYFGEANTGADFGGYYPFAPMLHDIAAIQRLYGANTETRAGATTYGFNSTADRAWYGLDSESDAALFCIWDGGGVDTLDLSGYGMGGAVRLAANAFSSVGGMRDNVSVAQGVVIENAIGGRGDDTIEGNSAANVLIGGIGADWLAGLDGDDHLIGDDRDHMTGGAGFDIADYSHSGRGIEFWDFGDEIRAQTPGETVYIRTVELLRGTGLGDTFTTHTGAIRFDGGAGDDLFYFQIGGGAVIQGGLGVDELTFRDIGPRVDFDLSQSAIRGVEIITGLDRPDTIRGDAQSNRIQGMQGDDVLEGGRGSDTLDGGLGRDTASYLSARGVTIDLTSGDNAGDAAGDLFIGIEMFELSSRGDRFFGGERADQADGLGGDDVLDGRGGNDSLAGRLGKDSLIGGAGKDQLEGGGSADRLVGGVSSDVLWGGEGGDLLIGEGGGDRLIGGSGKDLLSGGAGADRFVFETAGDSAVGAKRDAIGDFSRRQGDKIDLSGLVAGELVYLGQSAFSAQGAGEVRLTVTGAGQIIQVDIDGDGRVDLEILAQGGGVAGSDDFVL